MVNKNEAAGKAEQVKGSVKEKVGEWTNDPDLEVEGEADQASGKVRETAGKVQRKAEDAVDEIRKGLDR
jgi:uncharacterized protein YjbJ (UPF0337 family)